jgi:hypothetical protein
LITKNGAAYHLVCSPFLWLELPVMRLRVLLLGLFALLVTGCGGQPEDPATGGATQAESDQLNRAAQRLNQDQPPPRLTQGDLPKAPLPPVEQ